ncbi:Hsp70 family protein [Phytohabitans rumicis]|uniref:Molecular chaperone DnaK n=1 Tax=Phytohabitans rumicis TaxID=1076125 RepID=A0A6V8LIW3_9ACTN|nr:Hsp70 family protein [Phytohabitans rumicis]GFJ93997.1 hypothetical protein Prum_076390 [Phytohabitans rumicis]
MADERVSNAPVRLAIDFGTSHTVAVVRRDGQQPRSLLFDGSPLLPSCVYAAPGGELHTGRDAERLAQVDPGGFDPHPKRTVDQDVVLLGHHEFAPAALIGAVLGRVARAAAEAGAGPSAPAILTCPADWGRRRRAVLLHGAQQAGIRVEALVDEPVAAGTYCLDILDVAVGQALVVFDFGGGTLDVAAMRREPDGLRVLATGGLDNLGGLDVDAALVGQLGQLLGVRDPALWQRLANPTDAAALRDRRAFWAEVRAAKEMLSRTTSAPVPLPGDVGALHLTREELDRVAGPLVDRAVDETRRLLRDSRIGPDQLAGIFLVGGASRMPLVASKLHARLGVAPAVPEQPELPVAFGALRAAAVPTPPPGPSPEWPVTTRDIGVAPPAGAATRSRRGRIAAGLLAAVTLLAVAPIWWYVSQQSPDDTGSGAWQGPTGTASAGAAPTTPGPGLPAGFVSCADDRLCPTTATCWGGPVIIAGTATAKKIDCAKPHYSETFVAGYLPEEAIGVAFFELQERADIRRLCATSVLLARRRDPATTGTWEWRALPVQLGEYTVVHCIGSRAGEKARTGALFRAGA